MTDNQIPLLIQGASVIAPEDPVEECVYDERLMMSVSGPNAVPVHSNLEYSFGGDTRKTDVGRETTDDR
jgi:hypothetical protein